MKKSEIVELLNSKRKKMLPGQDLTSDAIISILEQAGMLPPLDKDKYHHMDNTDRIVVNQVKYFFSWEPENG